MKIISSPFTASLLLLVLAACGGSNSEDGPPPTPPTITTYDIDPSYRSPPLSGDPVIDSSYDNGQFSVDWAIEETDVSYEAALYVSKDQLTNTGDDIKFFSLDCGPDITACTNSGHVDCQFTTANKLSCSGGQVIDLTNWFSTLPQDVYVIFAARRAQNSVATSTMPVQFR